MKEIILKGTSDVGRRIDILTLLYTKAEAKVNHSDMFRQRNMNYALVIFAGFMALGGKLDGHLPQVVVSITLLILMLIFCVWDRRWHKTKHGWEYSSLLFYQKLGEVNNEPDKDVAFQSYYVEGERTAERFSFQPIVFYFLVAASLASFFIFSSMRPIP
jgi:hypothetical protein